MFRLPIGYVRMPGSKTLNSVLRRFGLAADVVVVDCNAGHPFGRRATVNDPAEVAKANQPDASDADRAKVRTDEQLAQASADVRASVDALASTLGIPSAPLSHAEGSTAWLTRPQITSVGFDFKPHRIPPAEMVQTVTGHGFLVGEYPHTGSLAMVTPADLVQETGLVIPFADAPPVALVYIGTTRAGAPLIITAGAQANWLVLSGDIRDNLSDIDLIGRLFATLETEVHAAGGVYYHQNVYAFVGPGASEGFEFKGDRSDKLSPYNRDRYVVEKEIPTGNSEETVIMPYLNLRGWVADLLRYHNVGIDNMFELADNTVTSTCYTTKRGRIGRERPADGSTPIPSNGMAVWIRPRRPDDQLLAT